MSAAAIISAIGTALSAASSAAGAVTAGNVNYKSYKRNKWLMEHQAALNRDFYDYQIATNRQNYEAYQSPGALRQQYEDAGLNPMAIYSGGQTSMAGGLNQSSGSASGILPNSSAVPDFNAGTANLLSALRSAAEIKNIESNTNKQDTETENIATQTEHERLKMELTSAETWLTEQQGLSEEQRTRYLGLINDITEKTAPATIAEAFGRVHTQMVTIQSIAQDVVAKKIDNRTASARDALELYKLYMSATLDGASAYLKSKQVELIPAQKANLMAIASQAFQQSRIYRQFADYGGGIAQVANQLSQTAEHIAGSREKKGKAVQHENAPDLEKEMRDYYDSHAMLNVVRMFNEPLSNFIKIAELIFTSDSEGSSDSGIATNVSSDDIKEAFRFAQMASEMAY